MSNLDSANAEIQVEDQVDTIQEDEVIELQAYQEYLHGDFKNSALDFLYKCGLLTPTLYLDNPELFLSKCDTQINQIKEELSEVLVAIDLNVEGHIDGHVDSMFTILNFLEMNKYMQLMDSELLDGFPIHKIQLIGNIADHIVQFPLPKTVTSEIMIAAAKRIVENNKLKYTDDYEVAKSWRIPVGGRRDGIKLQTVEYDGVKYYSLVDKNGKIRKHRDFVAVNLSDLVG